MERLASLPNALALVLYFKPLSDYLWYFTRTTNPFQVLTGQVSPPVVEGVASVEGVRGLLDSDFDRLPPLLNPVGPPVINWLDEWAISACQLLGRPGEVGRCQTA